MSFSTNVGANWQALIAVIAFLAGGLGYLRWAKSQSAVSTIKLLNDEINALKLQNARLEGDNKTLNAKFDEQAQRLNLLTDLVHGVPAWDALHASVVKLERNATRIDQLIDAYPTDWLTQTIQHYKDTRDIAAALKEEKGA